jgi:acetylornithine/succinyldiaminopimelate/putrescine aminotransferase
VVHHHPRSIELAERLPHLVPWMPDAQVFFCKHGGGGRRRAIKLARRVHRAGRTSSPSAAGFHGRTLGLATSINHCEGQVTCAGYEPLPRWRDDRALRRADFAELDAILATQTARTHSRLRR